MRRLLPLAGLGALLAACREEPPAAPAAAPPDPRPAAARAAAEVALHQRLRGDQAAAQRGVQVFAQALPDSFAVCGRVRPAAQPGSAFLPWVAVVRIEGEAVRVAELVLGLTGIEAARVFVEMTDRCFEGGGPPSARPMARALPPLPAPGATEVATGAAEPLLPASSKPPAQRPALGTVFTSGRHPANIRSVPRSGEIVRVVPRLTQLDVFHEAPGGWLEVGQDGAAWGWIHASVLEVGWR